MRRPCILSGDEIRVEIAILDGWKNVCRARGWGSFTGPLMGKPPHKRCREEVPLYDSSLDAIRGPVQNLSSSERKRYIIELETVVNGEAERHLEDRFYEYEAAPMERCRAYLHAKKKTKEI